MDKESNLHCKKCGSSSIVVQVDVLLSVHPRYFYELTKKAIKDKDVRLVSANWDNASIVCRDCNFSNKNERRV